MIYCILQYILDSILHILLDCILHYILHYILHGMPHIEHPVGGLLSTYHINAFTLTVKHHYPSHTTGYAFIMVNNKCSCAKLRTS